MRALALVCVAALLSLASLAPGADPGYAAELLRNGGFEDSDLSMWRLRGLSAQRAPATDAPEGDHVLHVTTDAAMRDPQWIASQAIAAVTPGADYRFAASLAVAGAAEAALVVEWTDAPDGFGASVRTDRTQPTTRADGEFQAVGGQAIAPARARSAVVRIEVRSLSGAVEVRADAVTFDGPPPVTPTPTGVPSETPSPSPTVTATLTATPSPTVTPTVGPGWELRNAGFEDAADGVPVAWEKYGGELASSAKARSGRRAAVLRSATDATKWAYQTVLVEGGRWYEFAAWTLHDDPGVARALLRVSWYASADGAGAAIASDDSLETLTAPSDAYVHLRTGPVRAPDEARSARVRILLDPRGASPAALVMDDASWEEAAPPTATPSPSPAPIASATSPPAGSSAAVPAETPAPAQPRVRARAEALGAIDSRVAATPSARGEAKARPALSSGAPMEGAAPPPGAGRRGRSWWTWTAGAAALALALAAASVTARGRRRIS